MRLLDPTRGVELTLDLRRNVVLYKDASLTAPQPLYRIVPKV